ELAEGPVAPIEAVTAAPELIAVTLLPVAGRAATVRDLARGGRGNPGRRHQRLPAPLPLAEIELAEAGNVFGRHLEPIAAERDPVAALLPGGVPDAQRLEEARPQVVHQVRA